MSLTVATLLAECSLQTLSGRSSTSGRQSRKSTTRCVAASCPVPPSRHASASPLPYHSNRITLAPSLAHPPTRSLSQSFTHPLTRSIDHDADLKQVLDSILVGPVPVGLNKFVFEVRLPCLPYRARGHSICTNKQTDICVCVCVCVGV
jgi:hypothetical protein